MKVKIFLGACIAATIGIMSFTETRTGIVGKVNPGDAAEAVWAIGTDSIKGSVSMGQFNLDAKAGTYKVIIDAKEPYKDVVLENVQVKSDETLDLGEIPLKQ